MNHMVVRKTVMSKRPFVFLDLGSAPPRKDSCQTAQSKVLIESPIPFGGFLSVKTSISHPSRSDSIETTMGWIDCPHRLTDGTSPTNDESGSVCFGLESTCYCPPNMCHRGYLLYRPVDERGCLWKTLNRVRHVSYETSTRVELSRTSTYLQAIGSENTSLGSWHLLDIRLALLNPASLSEF